MDGQLAIETQGLVKVFGETRAVDGIDLAIPGGTVYSVLGPNGAGKTTTIRMLATLIRPTEGTARVLGHDIVTEADAVRSTVGLTGQFASVDDELTGAENLVLLGRLLGFGWAAARDRADELLAAFGLAEAAGRLVKEYSGGMRRRLDIASSIVVTPELLFLDEPTTGLDPQSRRGVWEVVNRFKERRRTVLLTTHYMDEAERLCDRLAIVDHGRVIAQGTPRELITSLGGDHVVEISVAESDKPRPAAADLQTIPSVRSVHVQAGHFVLTVAEPHVAIPGALERLRAGGWELAGLTTRHASLEDVFVSLTGRQLRDE